MGDGVELAVDVGGDGDGCVVCGVMALQAGKV